MPILAIFDSPETTKKQYDDLRPIVKWETEHPVGVISHACSFDDKGGLHVVDIWNSEAELQTFYETRLLAGFRQVGINPPQPKIYALHNLNVFAPAEKYRAKGK